MSHEWSAASHAHCQPTSARCHMFADPAGSTVSAFWCAKHSTAPVVSLLCGPCLRGAERCSAWLSQILMASDPLWATLFAGVLGSAEQDLGPSGWAGGALIIAGAVLAGTGGSAPHGQRLPDEHE